MKILTSYYSKLENIDTTGMVLVRISQTQPDGITEKIYECKELYPDWKLIRAYKNGDVDPEEYKQEYSKQLTNKLRQKLLKRFEILCKKDRADTVVLLCWEYPMNFCHRQIAGPWLSKDCKEL